MVVRVRWHYYHFAAQCVPFSLNYELAERGSTEHTRSFMQNVANCCFTVSLRNMIVCNASNVVRQTHTQKLIDLYNSAKRQREMAKVQPPLAKQKRID